MAHDTASLITNRSDLTGDTPCWYLAVVLDAARPFAESRRIALEGTTEVSVGRGPARSVVREGGRLRLDLDDPFQSQEHFRLCGDRDGWRLEDAGSKNGTRLRGTAAGTAKLADGDVIEAGATFIVVRHTRGPAPDREVLPDDPLALRTLHAPLELDLALIASLATTRLPILIHGESGTGKELAARAVHALSGRSGPLVPVNCGALPSGIIESELFGARRGAFSGAVEDRPGLVRSAAAGTLFLDEIADLPLPAQAALLRLLQEGELRPLGSHQTVHVDVRVVAATHRDLDVLVARGAFRHDLAARLRGHVLTMPPLRARREDLGLLCAALLRRIEGGVCPGRSLQRAAARALLAYSWPDNARELEHALRAAVARGGAEIGLTHLPDHVRTPPAREPTAPRGTESPERRELILRLLEEHAGNLSAVARALGTSRSQLRRLAARLDIKLGRSE